MTQAYATTIVETWVYENEAEHMLDSDGWGSGIFAVLSQEGDLVRELSIEFFDAQGDYTEYRDSGIHR